MVGHAYDGLPDEACGLFAGPPGTDRVTAFYPCRNAAESSRVYTIDPKDHLRADRDAEGRGLEINGVMHSHTHTDAYPSPTDVAAGAGSRAGTTSSCRCARTRRCSGATGSSTSQIREEVVSLTDR